MKKLLLLVASSLSAANATFVALQWDPSVDHSRVTNYVIRGTRTSIINNPTNSIAVSVGTNTAVAAQITVAGPWFFTVIAQGDGMDGAPSNEVMLLIKPLPPAASTNLTGIVKIVTF